jgi:methionyl aminopeptidase
MPAASLTGAGSTLQNVSRRHQVRSHDRLCWCGSGRLFKSCHQLFGKGGPGAALFLDDRAFAWAVRPAPSLPRQEPPLGVELPDYALSGEPRLRPTADLLGVDEIRRLRIAGRQAAELLGFVAGLVGPGVTTDELDSAAYEECRRRGVYPSTLNFRGYPKSICTSVNEVICHGIPDSRPLAEGDIVNVDITVFAAGMHGDCSATICVGNVNPVARRLVAGTLRCLQAGISAAAPGRPFWEIGRAIEATATELGYSVVRQFVGHGIGPEMHTGYQVLHHYSPSESRRMEPGMAFTIEPMINAGTFRAASWDDGWTAVTADLARSAQFEHTVLITDTGVDVLTANPLVPTV